MEIVYSLCSLMNTTYFMVQGWKRYRHSCYTVTNQEQTIHDAQIGYYCHGHLLSVEDRCVIKCQLFALRTSA